MDLRMLSLGNSVPKGPCSVFFEINYQVYRGLAHNVVFLPVLGFDITQTHKDTQHTQGPTHCYALMNKYLHYQLRAHSSYVYYTEWTIH